VVCPSGPTAWGHDGFFKLVKNLGCELELVLGDKPGQDFADKQKLAWEKTRQAIDAGLPCYAWELDVPEYYVVYGYDDVGYYYRGPGCDAGKGPKPWKELGDSEIGFLGIHIVKPGKAAEDKTTVKEALQFALEWAGSSNKWTFPKYHAGPAGYDAWIAALETGEADGFGTAYNASCWSECRQHAVGFLKEAKERLDEELNPLFDETIGHYEVVAQNLKKVVETFPFLVSDEEKEKNIKDEARRRQAIEALKAAREAEAGGLKVLEKIVGEL